MPSCFMIMPYGRKATQADPKLGPAEIDFNALWDLAYVPAIKALGYQPVRADQDTGCHRARDDHGTRRYRPPGAARERRQCSHGLPHSFVH